MKKIISITLSLAMVITMLAGCSEEEVYRLIKVNSFEGSVTVEREEKMEVFEGLQLVSEDSVAVGEDSLLELLADSDKHIVAEENTAFTLHSTGTETSGNITIDMLYGKSLFTIDNKLPQDSTFEVNTPNASLSVRGTTFSVAYDSETETTSVEVIEGVVAVTNGEETEELIAGQATAITDDGIAPVSEIEETTNAPIGPRTKRWDYDDGSYIIYEYDANGNVIKRSDYNPGGTLDFYHTYEYDANGNKIKTSRYNADGSYSIHEYDANGNKIKRSDYNPDGTLKEYAIYEYDANGNKIKENHYNPDGTLQSEHTY